MQEDYPLIIQILENLLLLEDRFRSRFNGPQTIVLCVTAPAMAPTSGIPQSVSFANIIVRSDSLTTKQGVIIGASILSVCLFAIAAAMLFSYLAYRKKKEPLIVEGEEVNGASA